MAGELGNDARGRTGTGARRVGTGGWPFDPLPSARLGSESVLPVPVDVAGFRDREVNRLLVLAEDLAGGTGGAGEDCGRSGSAGGADGGGAGKGRDLVDDKTGPPFVAGMTFPVNMTDSSPVLRVRPLASLNNSSGNATPDNLP